ncbi:ATP-binding cassette domain-containing protein [Nocardia goodfellowii]|uniref:ATP-binding cassette subfamily B protein n=1 Tax=Nocardia goodfellowii TaxID=882446 RepID=A0ABS4QDQ7_9NOCA|nr:ATP-binding cassette domain-containing protein [Nocardia goodfellowii]MBP2189688.1 ATP-binding cassette subfamily B protein [Nocardia goodfellowii]
MTRYLRLWGEVLGISWRHARALTSTVFATEIGLVAANVGIALTMRTAVNNLVAHQTASAVIAAVVAASACTLVFVLNRMHGLVGLFLVVETVSVVIEDRLMHDIAKLETLEHLESSEYLDRITVLRGAPRRIVGGMWAAVRTCFTILQLVLTLLLLGTVSPWLLVLLLLAVAPLWCDRKGRELESRAETDTAEAFRLQQHLFDIATDAGAGKEIRTSRAGYVVAQLQAAAMREVTAGRYAARVRAAGLRALGWIVFVVGFTVSLGVVAHLAKSDAATAGDVVLVVTLTVALQQTVQAAVGQLTMTMNASVFLEPYLWLRSYLAAERKAHSSDQPPPKRLRSGIRFEGVSFTYCGSETPVLQDINVLLPAGSVIALVGEFGSGKSTFVKLLSKFYKPGSGIITVDGVDLQDIRTEDWRRRTSAAYQDFGRYAQMTLAEAIGLGDIDRLTDEVALASAISAADAEGLVQRLSAGIDTRLSPIFGGVDLSEGQWQKVALARSSMRSGPLLFMLDEPTASLDAPSEHAIFQQYMQRARRLAVLNGAITLVVSHRLSTVADADLLLVLDRGRIVEYGTHQQLLAHNGRYSKLHRQQANAYNLRPGHALHTSADEVPL